MWKYCILVCISICFTFSNPSKRSADRDVAPCLRKFYNAVYNESYNCTIGLDFSYKNFTAGKSCFLEVVKHECTPTQYDELDSEFDYFVEILTSEPSDDNCDNPYYQYHGQQCMALLDYVGIKNKELYPMETKINDSRVLDVIRKCEEVEECIKPVCISTDTVKSVISGACEKLRMKNSEFMTCQFELDRIPIEKMNVTCLQDFDFFANTLSSEIEKFSTKKECTREIMEKNCGKKAVEKFDYYSDLMLKVLETARDDEED